MIIDNTIVVTCPHLTKLGASEENLPSSAGQLDLLEGIVIHGTAFSVSRVFPTVLRSLRSILFCDVGVYAHWGILQNLQNLDRRRCLLESNIGSSVSAGF